MGQVNEVDPTPVPLRPWLESQISLCWPLHSPEGRPFEWAVTDRIWRPNRHANNRRPIRRSAADNDQPILLVSPIRAGPKTETVTHIPRADCAHSPSKQEMSAEPSSENQKSAHLA